MSKYTSATLTAAIAALDAAGYPATYSDALSKAAAIGPRALAREASIMNCKYVAPDARDDDRIGAEQANAALAALIIEIVGDA